MKKRTRKVLNKDCPEEVIKKFKCSYNYDSETGEITNSKTGREYHSIDQKGYERDLYRTFNSIEYFIKYSRLCWLLYYDEFVPSDLQIDHKDNIVDNNKIDNLQIVTNEDNALKKKLVRKNNTSGYKGVSYVKDISCGKEYYYYAASISINKKLKKIGRFKNKKDAAKFYDSANRYYYGKFSFCNFEIQYIKPMSILDLRKYKKENNL